MAEAIMMALAEEMLPEEAEAILKNATQVALAEGRPLTEVVKESTDVELDWDSLADESEYLGSSQWFIDRLLQEAED